jgi:transposase-like protein
VLCVRWYLRVKVKLSSRDLVQMMAERGVALTHTTILRWVQRYVPEFEKRWNQYSRPVGASWRCDETYIKVKGRWTYLDRAVDKQGWTVDFLLSERRNVAAARRFFSKAMKKHGVSRVITLDAYAASHRAITELKSAETMARRVRIRSCKYLNNVVGAGFSPNQTADSADARVQTIRDSGNNDQRHRTCREDSETPAQDGKSDGKSCRGRLFCNLALGT